MAAAASLSAPAHAQTGTGADRRTLTILGLVTLAAAVLRFATLDVQSLWGDEAATVLLLQQSLGTMLSHLGSSESTPPFYYILAWAWTHVFGTGAVGVRSLSALIGVATVPVAWAAARPASERAGLWVAAIAAANPLTFYYAQEARSYALLILLAGLSFVLFQRALEDPSRRRLAAWAGAAALALLTHYFAVFVIAGEVLWLVRRHGLRLAAPILSPVILVGLALVPLAVRQRSDGKSDWIEGTSLPSRVAQAPKQFLVGIDSPLELLAAGLAGVIAVLAIALLVRRGNQRERDAALLAASVAAVAMALPMLLSLSGALDLFNGRNVVEAWIPVATLVAIGVGTSAAPRIGNALGGALCLLMLATVVGVLVAPKYQRDDNRSIARDLRSPVVSRVIVDPVNADLPLYLFLSDTGLRAIDGPMARTTSLAIVNFGERRTGGAPLPPVLPASPPAGFRLDHRRRKGNYAIAFYRAPTPQVVDLRAAERLLGEGAKANLQPAR